MLCLAFVRTENTFRRCRERLAKQCSALFCNRVTRNGRIFSSTSRWDGTGQAVNLAYKRYQGSNDNTPLVVIHGLFGSKRNWANFCKTYNQITGREIIAVDCRNHGESAQSDELSYSLMCYDIEETLAQLDILKAAFIGHSMGGKVAMNMALSMPRYVEKLVVVDINPSPIHPERSKEFQGLLQAMINLDLSQIKTRKDADNTLATSIPEPDLRAFLLTNLVKTRQGNFKWQLNLKGFQQNLEEIGKGVDLNGREIYVGPTLFVAGGESESLKAHDLAEIKVLFPNARLDVVPGAGHMVHADKPKEFLHILQKFLC